MGKALFVAAICLLFLPPAYSEHDLSMAMGSAFNIPLPVSIKQSGYAPINFNGHFDTKPFASPPYYMLRYSHWKNNRAWEIEFIHHKLYLENPPSNVQIFSITNGYNLITANLAWRTANQGLYYVSRIGLGVVLTHPESTIRGKKFSEEGGLPWFDTDGYFLSGGTVMGAVGMGYRVSHHVAFFLEAMLSLSYVSVPVYAGFADVSNASLHGLAGIKYIF